LYYTGKVKRSYNVGMNSSFKLPKSFYSGDSTKIAPEFLGKYLVRSTPQGTMVGIITEVEAYPPYVDQVSHGNKRTKRTEIMYGEGGSIYVYLIYGLHYLFGVVVNKKDIPDMVLIRGVKPVEGIDLMNKYFGRTVKNSEEMTKSPGNLCKAFNITMDLYGEDLQGDKIWIEDRGISIRKEEIRTSTRVGINKDLSGSDANFRFNL